MSLIPDPSIADRSALIRCATLKRNTSTMTSCEIDALPLQSAARVRPNES